MDESTNAGDDSEKPAKPRRGWKSLIPAVVFVVIAAAVTPHIVRAVRELKSHPVALSWNWISVAVLFYALSLVLMGTPWWHALKAAGSPVPWPRTIRVYLIATLGKYVPGKAMVLVIRSGLLGTTQVPLGKGAATSVYETLTNMGSGGLLAIILLLTAPLPEPFSRWLEGHAWIVPAACLPTAAMLVAVTPRIFQLLGLLITTPLKSIRGAVDIRFPSTLLPIAIGWGLLAWAAAGFSYFAVIQAVTGVELGLRGYSMTTAVVSLSVMVGFLSMIPGQIGIRELILIESLIPVLGEDRLAVLATLLFRAVTLFVEIVLAASLYFGGGRR